MTSTFILCAYIPSPVEILNHDNNDLFHSVEKVVGGHQHGRHFEEPKGHLRKSDLRYEHKHFSESSTVAKENERQSKDEENIEDYHDNEGDGDQEGSPLVGSRNNENEEIEIEKNDETQQDGSSLGKSNKDNIQIKLQENGSSSNKHTHERNDILVTQNDLEARQDIVDTKDQKQETTLAATAKEMEEPQILHILETRFMQNQPDLVQLAKARLQLFEAICLPTVVQQTAWGNFLWIIRTDPNIHVQIREELIEMLNDRNALTMKIDGKGGAVERALTYVIGSNDNYIVANSTTVNPQIRPFDVQDMLSNMISKPDKIFTGKIEELQSTLDSLSSEAKDIIMWTRLDADDGLSTEFLKYIEDKMMQYFVPDKVKDDANKNEKKKADFRPSGSDSEDDENEAVVGNNSGKSKTIKAPQYSPPNWMYWCGGQNIDWFLTDPIHDPKHDAGIVYPVLHDNVCVTPGITVSIRGSMKPALVPRLDHDKIVSYLDEVGGKACNRTGDVKDDDNASDDGSCFQMSHGWTHAIRSRTPTSAGMMGVNPDENQLKMILHNKNLKKIMWREMHEDFLLKDDDLRKTNSYFAKHVYEIAEENARGQCTNGHSCKTSSKDRLQQFTDLKGESDGGFNVVDGIMIIPKS